MWCQPGHYFGIGKIRHEIELYFFEQVTIQIPDECLCDSSWYLQPLGDISQDLQRSTLHCAELPRRECVCTEGRERIAVEFLGYSTT
jgi:hypothetical protein